MRDGLKWTITGGVVGLLLLITGTLVINALAKKMTEVKIEWLVAVSLPLVTGIWFWYVKFTDKMKENVRKEIYEAISKKADDINLQALKQEVKDNKENNKLSYDLLFETMESMDKKLDVLIQKL